MEENVLEIINKNYNSFSRSNKKIAKYILKNYDLIPLRNLNELKEEIGVSEATISRFSKILGYKNFNSFQKDFEQFAKKNHLSFEEIKSNLQKENGNFLYSESKYSDIVLEARNSSKTFTIISTIVVINALVLYFANLNSERSIKFYNQHNEIANSLGLYLDVTEDN